MKPSFIRTMIVCVGAAAIAACASTPTSFTVTDARHETRFGDRYTTVAGAQVLLSDDGFTPRLIDRLSDRFERDLGPRLAGAAVVVTAAQATLFIEDATALPPRDLRVGQPVEVVRNVRATAHKTIVVTFEGEVRGRHFVGEARESWVTGDGDLQTARAVNRALAAASGDLAAKL